MFIEAGPGSGKTTVAAQRFGAQRFSSEGRDDNRAVVAVSFTRAATWELHRRVKRHWGPSALAWPHRIVTLDTLMYELLADLLASGLVNWPNGHCDLRVEDSWKVVAESFWQRGAYWLKLDGRNVVVITGYTQGASQRVPPEIIKELLETGTCTHEDVRDILEQALLRDDVRAHVATRLAATMRALIVDEVFDANDLDIAVIESAIRAGVEVSVVGDPWQALYVFRGARPEAVPGLIARTGMITLPLTESFRWRKEAQRTLAEKLREGEGVALDKQDDGGAGAEVNVVLGVLWQQVWDVGAHVLPLAFHASKGGTEEAAATLLLNHVTRNVFGEDATYLGDALTTLAITDHDIPRQLEDKLQNVLDVLLAPGKKSLNAAYDTLVAVIKNVSPRHLRPAHTAHTKRLEAIRVRSAYPDRPVLGLTTHQAKGREWDIVGIRLTPNERAALAEGLIVTEDTHRKLYVACTRARVRTVEV